MDAKEPSQPGEWLDPLGSLCRPSTCGSRLSDSEVHPHVLAGREQNLRCGLVVGEVNKRGVAECFDEYGLRDYFDAFGQRRFCNLSMTVAARRHLEVSKTFGSSWEPVSAPKPDVLFSAIAYRKANAMIQQDKQLQRSMKDAQFRSLESGEKFRVADVRERQLQLILQGFPGSRQHVVVPFVPLTMTDEVLLPLEPLSRQKEREDRKRSEKYNGYLAERNPQTVFLVKHQGWLFSFDDVHSIWQKLDQWMAAVALTPIWGIDRSTFSQLLVDLDLPDEERLPYFWSHQVFDSYAKPTRLAAGDPDYDESDAGERSALCVSRWDFMAVLDRLLRRRFELSPREEFLQRLRMAHRALQREWRGLQEQSRAAAEALQGKTKDVRESQQWKFDRHTCCLLKEPEALQTVEQFRGIFKLLFKGYARHRGNQHMSEADFSRFCEDAMLVPSLVSRHEAQRLYSLAVCLEQPPEVPASLPDTLTVPRTGSKDRAKAKAKAMLKEVSTKRRVSATLAKQRASSEGLQKFKEAQASLDERSKPIFGEAAFAESLCRLAIGHLLVYGNGLQQTISAEARVVWLVSYLVEVLRTQSEAKLLELVSEEDFAKATRPCAQCAREPESPLRPSAAPRPRSDSEDEEQSVEAPAAPFVAFARDAPGTRGWLLTPLLKCGVELTRRSRSQRKTMA